MSLFVIMRKDGIPVRYGVNGGGSLGFCMHIGCIAAFTSHAVARNIVEREFDNPKDYHIVRCEMCWDGFVCKRAHKKVVFVLRKYIERIKKWIETFTGLRATKDGTRR